MPIPLIIGGALAVTSAWGTIREEFDLPPASDLLVAGYRAVVGDDEDEDEDYDDYGDDDYDEDEGDEE